MRKPNGLPYIITARATVVAELKEHNCFEKNMIGQWTISDENVSNFIKSEMKRIKDLRYHIQTKESIKFMNN